MIKEKPQDFIVKELLDLDLDDTGDYAYYELTKTDTAQEDAFKTICNKLNIKRKLINYAGTKDKKAVTTQFISIFNGPKKDYDFDNVKLKYIGQGKERISLGQLKANHFEITVKTDKEPRKITQIPNYFDDQRFGINKNNHIIGKLLLQKKFKEAAGQIKQSQRIVDMYLQSNPTDFVGAIRSLPKKIMQMYIHAYQSFLFNELLKKEIEKTDYFEVEYAAGVLFFPKIELANTKLPLIGFGTEENVEKVLVSEGITLRDFIMKQIPELSSEGAEREAFIEPKDLEVKKIDNGYLVSFSLPAGSYATVVIKAMFE